MDRMTRRDAVCALLALGAASRPPGSFAQKQGKVWRVGILEMFSAQFNAPKVQSFRIGMRELGYVHEQNLAIEYRSAGGRAERFAGLADELVRLNVDAIVTRGTQAAVAAKNATATIPVVNISGFSAHIADLHAKRLELLLEVLPRISRIGALMNSGTSADTAGWGEIEKAARSKGIRAQLLDVKDDADLRSAFAAAGKQRIDAMIVGLDSVIEANQELIVQLAAMHRVPAIYSGGDFADVGGLIAYGPDYSDLYRRAGILVGKVFNGGKPGDLAVGQPTKFELALNVKTAKALGLRIPAAILARVTRTVE